MSAPLILLVSSDEALVETVRAAVAATRREFRHLGSDYGAMAVIHAAGPGAALALVDIEPTLHGFELCRAASQHMPVIALLGGHDAKAEETAREHGACGCLCKPLDAAGVRTLLDETLGMHAPVEL
jgi:DNA-binding response OmpR family regulator